MAKYVLKRLALAIATVWAVITVTFILMHSVPGDPFANDTKKYQRQYIRTY